MLTKNKLLSIFLSAGLLISIAAYYAVDTLESDAPAKPATKPEMTAPAKTDTKPEAAVPAKSDATAETMAPARPTIEYAKSLVDMQLKKISEHVYYVQGRAGIATDNEGFISNASVIITDDGIVIFDALGTPSLAMKLLELIREISDQPIVKVVMSHYHADHLYGLQIFQEQGAVIIAPFGVDTYIRSDVAKSRLQERQFSLAPWVNENTRVVAPDIIVEKGMQFQLGGIDFVINFIGSAHSDGDMTLYVKQDNVLLSGDIIFEGRVPFIGNGDTGHWLKTLEEMETRGLAALIPGHGPAATSPGETISMTRRYLAYMRDKMGTAVDELQSFDEAYAETDWSQFESLPAFKEANRINAYQVFLSMEAELLDQ